MRIEVINIKHGMTDGAFLQMRFQQVANCSYSLALLGIEFYHDTDEEE